jgi:hypothetical protein
LSIATLHLIDKLSNHLRVEQLQPNAAEEQHSQQPHAPQLRLQVVAQQGNVLRNRNIQSLLLV